jgi:hypothetical protein
MTAAKAVPAKIFDNFLSSLELDEELLDQLARGTGWCKAEPRKITLGQLLLALSIESIQGEASFNDISSRIHLLSEEKGPSRQAVSKRINLPFLKVLETLLAKIIAAKANCGSLTCKDNTLSRYDRVLVQDSTVIRLPGWLFARFSGVSNAHQTVCNARIQATYDLKNMVFVSFEICSYSDNDLKAAPRLELRKNDFVLRDRGYLTATEVARHVALGAHCIYRHKTGTVYLDSETGEPIDLLAELRRNGSLDRTVVLNDKKRTTVRLVSAPVTEEVANHRRMKAKKEMKGHNPSAEVLALMNWTIFLTNAGSDVDFADILRIYGLRWRIEIIFKTWKSHLNFSAIHRVSEIELRSILTMRLLLITEGTNVFYRLCYHHIKTHHDRDLSLQKFLKRLGRSPELAGMIIDALIASDRDPGMPESKETEKTWDHLVRYCCYDKRKRKNFHDQSNG